MSSTRGHEIAMRVEWESGQMVNADGVLVGLVVFIDTWRSIRAELYRLDDDEH